MVLTDRQIDNRAKKIKALEAEKKALEEAINALKEELKYFFDYAGLTETETTGYKIIFKDIESTRFDTKTFKKEHKNLYDKYNKTIGYKRLTISEK